MGCLSTRPVAYPECVRVVHLCCHHEHSAALSSPMLRLPLSTTGGQKLHSFDRADTSLTRRSRCATNNSPQEGGRRGSPPGAGGQHCEQGKEPAIATATILVGTAGKSGRSGMLIVALTAATAQQPLPFPWTTSWRTNQHRGPAGQVGQTGQLGTTKTKTTNVACSISSPRR